MAFVKLLDLDNYCYSPVSNSEIMKPMAFVNLLDLENYCCVPVLKLELVKPVAFVNSSKILSCSSIDLRICHFLSCYFMFLLFNYVKFLFHLYYYDRGKFSC